jgi:hypothetical protein
VSQISPSESDRRMDYFEDHDVALMNAVSKTSNHNQATMTLISLVLGALVVIACLTMVAWLAFHGPAIVPGQDTRITAVLISTGSRLAWLFICAALLRSAWGSLLPSPYIWPVDTCLRFDQCLSRFHVTRTVNGFPFAPTVFQTSSCHCSFYCCRHDCHISFISI